MLSSSDKYELKKKFRHLEAEICKLDTALDNKADLVDGVVPTSQLPITQDIIDALNNANAPDGINYFTTIADLSSITPGTLINVAANYSALPAANTVPGEFYWVENSQGTSWLPGPLGGTYYPNGLYYSNGTTWIFTDVPFNATQVEVDAGLNNNKFLTPQTFANAAKWDTKFDNWTVTTANTGTLTGENVLWLADTTAPRTRTLDSAGSYVHIKDTTGNALTNNITINAPVGQTINGNASETIDADFGWVEYKLVGTDWVTTEGDSGAASNQLIIDSTPTNASTNPVSSDGVYDALQLKQDTVSLTTTGTSGAATLVGSTLNIPQYQGVLTNPVTGTGTAGQVAYFSGTSAVTGSAGFVYDAVNQRVGIGTASPSYRLHIVDSTGGINPWFTPIATLQGNGATFYLQNSGTGGGFGSFGIGASTGNFILSHSTQKNFLIQSTDGSTFLNRFNIEGANGNVNIGVGTAASARLHVRGSGTTSATTALLVQNSTPTALLTVRDDGYTLFGSGNSGTPLATLVDFRGNTDNDYIQVARVSSSSDRYVRIYAGGQIDALSIGTSSPPFTFAAANNPQTSGNRGLFSITNTFNPTSGNATYTSFLINQTINQTGGANGITRGLYVNPTLTAAADWRSIETSNNTGYAIYAGGTANSYFGGNVGIGTASPNNKLSIDGNLSVRQIDSYLQAAGVTQISLSGSGGAVIDFRANNTAMLRVASSGVFVGSDTSASARLHVRGSGTTSATTALLVQNSGASALLQVNDDGGTRISGLTSVLGANVANVGLAVYANGTGGGNFIMQGLDSSSNLRFRLTATGNFRIDGATDTGTSGDDEKLRLNYTFAPTSGTRAHNGIWLLQTINQTGGANGITRGLYVNPTLTAAADWRSVEFSNNTGWGLYGAGSANNYLAGRLGLNNTSLTNVTLRNSLAISGSISSYGYFTDAIITSGVTSTASYFHISPQTQNASFTLTNLNGYYVENPTIGASSTVTNVFGFYGNIASGTGRWNLYMNGTAANYLAGNTSIGTTTSGGKLTVRGETTTSASNGFLVEDSAGVDVFTLRNDGGYAFKGGTVGLAQTGYTTFTNLTTDRTCDANATTVEELADILGTLIEDLKTKGIIAA